MFKFLLEITSHFEAPQERPLVLIFIYKSRTDVSHIYRAYYMAAWGYEFYLRVLKVSLTSARNERVRDTFSTRREHSYPQAAM